MGKRVGAPVGAVLLTLTCAVLLALAGSTPALAKARGKALILDYWLEPSPGNNGQTTELLHIATSEPVVFKLDKWTYANCVFLYSPDLAWDGKTCCSDECLKHADCSDHYCVQSIACLSDSRGSGLQIGIDESHVSHWGIDFFSVQDLATEGHQSITVLRLPTKQMVGDLTSASRSVALRPDSMPIVLRYASPQLVITALAAALKNMSYSGSGTIVGSDGSGLSFAPPTAEQRKALDDANVMSPALIVTFAVPGSNAKLLDSKSQPEGKTSATPRTFGKLDEDYASSLNAAIPNLIVMQFDALVNGAPVQGVAEFRSKLEALATLLDSPARTVKLKVQVWDISEEGLKTLGISATNDLATTFLEQDDSAKGYQPFSLNDFRRQSAMSLNAKIAMIAHSGQGNLLAEPTLSTLEGKPAIYSVAKQIPYVAGVTDTGGTVTTSVQYVPVGIELQFMPRISNNDSIILDIRPTISTLTDTTLAAGTAAGTASNVNAPVFQERHLQTIVTVKNGEPFVLGGMITEEQRFDVDKVPVLGDVPLLGKMFRRKHKTTDRSQICIIVIPEILEDLTGSGTVSRNANSAKGDPQCEPSA